MDVDWTYLPQNKLVQSCYFGYMTILLLALQIGSEHCSGRFWPLGLLYCLAELLIILFSGIIDYTV